MVYANDQWIQLPTRDLYDTQVMAMAINAARDMYEKGLLEMKDFQKTYGDFLTPIMADLDWYNLNVTGKVRDAVNALYAKGIDPLRNALGRAIISLLINNMPYGDIAKLRESAKNAELYLKARTELEMKGLYNPLMAKYDGPDMATYSTRDSGIWDKMSPTPFLNVATFGNPYFEGMKPNVHRESKNGIDYSIESITELDLKNVADAHFNELVNTPQGQMMFKYYRDLAGGDNNPKANEEARRMFNEAIADGQRRRIYTKDDYDDQWTKREQLKQGWAKINQDAEELQLKRDQFNWEKDYYDRVLAGEGQGGQTTVPTVGAADLTALDQNKQYATVREKYYKQLENNESISYSKLSKEEKEAANRYRTASKSSEYKKALKVLNDQNATETDKKVARDTVTKYQNASKNKNYPKSEAFNDWVNNYNTLINKEISWSRYQSSLGENSMWGKPQEESTLLSKSHEAFQRQNIINEGNAMDTGMLTDINHALALTEDGDDHVGTVGNGTEFSPIVEAGMTGGRTYKYNSKVSKINRLIKGKQYKISQQEQTNRKYGHGFMDGAEYDVIQQKARFEDKDVVENLNKYTDAELAQMGIEKVLDNGTTVAYNIPITSRFSRGSLTWANVNTETHKRIGGASEAYKNRASEQARSIMSPIK